MISPDLLEILACPACESRPAVKAVDAWLVCVECGRRYPVRDGIPVMLVDEAELPSSPAPPPGSASTGKGGTA